MSDGDEIEHIERSPLPWHGRSLTQCGIVISTLKRAVISRDDFNAKIKRLGSQRTAMTTCITCYNTIKQYPHAFEEDPISVMQRELSARAGWNRVRAIASDENAGRDAMIREMRAIAIMIRRHREEFDELLTDQAETVPIRPGLRR